MKAGISIALISLSLVGCAGNPLPDAPKIASVPANYAQPPMRPIAPPTPEPRIFAQQSVTVTVGAGDDSAGPQQATLRLGNRENINKMLWPNPELLAINSALVGSPRDGYSIVTFKPLGNVAPTTHDVLIATNLRQVNVSVSVVPGRSGKTSFSLGEPKSSKKAAATNVGNGCADTLFSWQRNTVPWAPMSVCAYITPSGSYQTVVMFTNRMQGTVTATAVRSFGEGQTLPSILNYRRRPDGALIIDGIWPVVRLSGEGGSVDIVRAAAS